MTDLQSQMDLEELYNKNQTTKRLRQEFETDANVEYLEAQEIPVPFAMDLLCQICLHKRASPEVMIGILHHHFEDAENPFQACAEMLEKAVDHDLLDYDETLKILILKHDASPECWADLERYQFPLPHVVAPKPVRSNRDTGFYASSGSLLLRRNHHEDDICLDHINRVNSTALTVDLGTAEMIQNKWKGLDRRKPDETEEKYQKRLKAFQKYDRVSKDIVKSMALQGDTIWLTHRYDKRGRTYAHGYHINPQGNAWNKAVVQFANQERIKE
jgi:hypothetical protein